MKYIKKIKTYKIQYKYVTVAKGKSTGVTIPKVPPARTCVATVHTHAAYDPYFLNDNFSDGDKSNAKDRGVPNYLTTPSGTVRKCDPDNLSSMPDGAINVYWDTPRDPNWGTK